MTTIIEIETSSTLMGHVADATTVGQRVLENTSTGRPAPDDAQAAAEDRQECIRDALRDLEHIRKRLEEGLAPPGANPREEVCYRGSRQKDQGAIVEMMYQDRGCQGTLEPRNDLWNHSPDGFEWGYAGSGPAQLALAILAQHTLDDRYAVRRHQDFKREVISHIRDNYWLIRGEEVADWIGDHP